MKPADYFGVDACCKYGFPYIEAELTSEEQAPSYESEPVGMAELTKVLDFVQNDEYYPTFEEKCAYLLCSIAGSQYFSNGNKRLSVTVLLMFLMKNRTFVLNDEKKLKAILAASFPKHTWEENPIIQQAYFLFLYNLAVVLGDRKKWESDDFTEIRKRVAEMFLITHETE